jgi:hypothetical protein
MEIRTIVRWRNQESIQSQPFRFALPDTGYERSMSGQGMNGKDRTAESRFEGRAKTEGSPEIFSVERIMRQSLKRSLSHPMNFHLSISDLLSLL